MGKKRKHGENGTTSKPRDEMPLKRSSDASPYSLSDALREISKHIQVKENTDESVQKLEQRVQQLEDKVEVKTDDLVRELQNRVEKLEDKVETNEVQEKERVSKIKEDLRKELNEFKEDLRKELNNYKEELRNELENIENRSSQCFSVLKQDFKKELEVKDEPSLGIQEEGWAKVHHLNESPSLRSQPHQSETTRFKLKIENKVDQVVYKGKPIRTDDSEHITVVLYDGDNQIAPDHHLASAVVQLVVVDGEFNEPEGFWSKDDFEKRKTMPRQGSNPNLVKNGRFKLAGGKCRHKGVIITDNSNRREFMLGVMIVGDTDERVLGGLSNTFRVQEAKTEKDRAKRNNDDSREDLLRYTTGQVHMPNKNGQGQRFSLQQTRPNLPSMANPPFHQECMVQAANKRHSSGLVGSLMANGIPQQGTNQLENRGQVQQFQTTGQGQHYQTGSVVSFMENQSQITYGPTAGNGSVRPPFDNLQLYPAQQSAQLKNYGQGRQHNNVLRPMCTFAVGPSQGGNGVQLENHGNSSVEPVPVGHLQQYPTQQSTVQLGNHGQGRQRNSGMPTTQVNSVFMSNLPQQNTTQQGVQPKRNDSVDPHPVEHVQQYPTQQGINQQENCGRQHHSVTRPFTFAHEAAGNGAGRELVVERVPQQNATQQGVQVDIHGQSRQHNSVTQTFAVLPSQTLANAAAGNGAGGELVVEDILQQNTTQQGVQLDNHRSDLGLGLGLSTHNIPTGPSAGDLHDNYMDETLRHLHDNLLAPDDPGYLGLLSHAEAADQGGPSAGTRQWSTNQLHAGYSAGMHLSGFRPQTEDGGSTVSGLRTAAPAPEGTQMDFTQPTVMAPWEP
ncbi:hypothetical protein VPH35_131794 [Triticum aestivum]|uniref:Calmodulin binding protein-like N-terminal domain-containing protein n=1 Tax=Triticum aestivum TaxID=4565 RepID=A0A3B6SM64_WHEAT|nr:uncharacterized protein LOC123159554 isoform X1 [Triticum aestivum]